MKKISSLKFTLLLGLFIFLSFSHESFSQQWGDYTLYATKNGTKAYLVDNTSPPSTFHQWTFSSSKRSAYSAYLIPGDTLVRTYKPSGNPWNSGAITGGIQKVTWDGTVAWDYTYYSSSYSAHHDICPMPNGNVLIISYDKRSSSEAVQAGSSSASTFWSEKIVEVKPTGPTTGTIVWEWYLWDHLCQNHDASKDNYVTSIVDNPQLMNINYGGNLPDRYHMNGLDYNEDLDQIALSMHFMNSLFIIDHSTTTSEAAGHTGGNSGKGGDFLYRWGNPASWNASGSTTFNVIHDAHWITSDHPSYPNYLCAYNNNGGTGGKTAVDIWEPPYNGYNYTLTPGQETPSSSTYQYTSTFTANNEGNSQQLPNGNMIINNFMGSIYEVNSSGVQLWTKTNAQSSHAYRYTKCYVRAPKASADISEEEICDGEEITLYASAESVTETNPIYDYYWESTETGFTSTDQNPTDTPASSTTYIVTITNTALGCSDTASVSVTVTAGITVTLDPISDVCANDAPFTLSGGLPSGGTYSGAGVNGGIFDPTSAGAGIHEITYSYTAGNGCTGSDVEEIIVHDLPPADAGINQEICNGETITLTASGGTSYLWNTGQATASIIISPSTTTVYTVYVTDSNGCENTDDVVVFVNPIPFAEAGFDQSICQGDTALLTASGGTSYIWSTGQATASINVSPSTTTVYTVYVTDSNGCEGMDDVIVTVDLVPTADAGADQIICMGDTTMLTASGGSSYLWSSGQTTASINVSPSATTQYSVTVTDGNGCEDADDMVVTVVPVPTADAGEDQVICIGDTTLLTASGGSSYLWSSGQTTASINVSPTTTTTYTVTVIDSSGCEDTDDVLVIVEPIPTANAGEDQTICEGETTILTASGGTKYVWSSGDTISSINVTPTTTTTYSVTVTDNGCSSTAMVDVIVNALPTASVSTTNASCGVADGSATIIAAGGTGSYTYLWDSNTGNQTTQTATNLAAGSYDVTVNDGNCSAIATGIVNEDGAPTITISQSNDTICEGQSVSIIATGADSYTWTPATGLNTTIGDTVIATPTSTITYTVEGLMAGCSAFENISIIVNPLAISDFSFEGNNQTYDFTNLSMNASTYSWNFGDGNTSNLVNPSHSYALSGSYNVVLIATNNCGSDTLTSLIDVITGTSDINEGNNEWSIYPNPTNGMIKIESSQLNKVIITNSLGDVLEITKNVSSMDLSRYPDGIYYISIISTNGLVFNQEIILLK